MGSLVDIAISAVALPVVVTATVAIIATNIDVALVRAEGESRSSVRVLAATIAEHLRIDVVLEYIASKFLEQSAAIIRCVVPCQHRSIEIATTREDRLAFSKLKWQHRKLSTADGYLLPHRLGQLQSRITQCLEAHKQRNSVKRTTTTIKQIKRFPIEFTMNISMSPHAFILQSQTYELTTSIFNYY